MGSASREVCWLMSVEDREVRVGEDALEPGREDGLEEGAEMPPPGVWRVRPQCGMMVDGGCGMGCGGVRTKEQGAGVCIGVVGDETIRLVGWGAEVKGCDGRWESGSGKEREEDRVDESERERGQIFQPRLSLVIVMYPSNKTR